MRYNRKQDIKNSEEDDNIDNVYYNITINQESRNDTTTTPTMAKFTANLNSPILDKASAYKACISRFSISASDTPLFIFRVRPTVFDPIFPTLFINTGVYSVTLSFGGSNFTEPVIYIPENNYQLPTASIPHQQITPYYYVYSYQHMIDMINNTLLTAFTKLKVAFPAGPFTEAPFFIFDSKTQLISLVAQLAYLDNSTPPALPPSSTNAQIWANIKLVEKFIDSLDAFFAGNDQPNEKDYMITVKNRNNTNLYQKDILPVTPSLPITPPLQVIPNYVIMSEEYNTLYKWFSLRTLLFVTNTMPTNAEFIKNRADQSNTTDQGINSSLRILASFQPRFELGGDSRSYLYYAAVQYKYIDLLSDHALEKINIDIFWQDEFGELFPINIDYGQEATIQLLFIKKSYLKYH